MNALDRQITGKPVTVTLGDKEYTLAYPLNAVIIYQEKTGDNLFVPENWNKIAPGQSPSRFLACLWAGLRLHHPEVTMEELGSLVDFSNAGELTEAIARALTLYFPQKKEASPNVDAPAETLPAAS